MSTKRVSIIADQECVGIMSDAERDRLLVEINTELKQICRSMDSFNAMLYGCEGTPGVLTRLYQLEQNWKILRYMASLFGAVLGFIGGIIASIIQK